MSIPSGEPAPLELWAGVECTVNRVGDRYGDQMEQNGHAARISDLDLFAGLGVKALRYPILWERTAPDSLNAIDWTWADARLARLSELNIRPIVGLAHHGSGPRHTHLAAPTFALELAAYAGKVAERFPHIDAWTPVNEPLTTARFSGLYGHWYPHGTTEQLFARCLIHQCRAVVLAMQAVRKINPAAQLVQTDDLGKIYSTPHLRYQADFENERRWLSWDLLCGRVNCHHRMWGHLLWAGIDERELSWFLDNPCPPDVIGINHYLTSERFIDERHERYPAESIANNGRDRYADVEAVRVLRDGTPGVRGMIQECWDRYGLPLAITEAHLGCTREEQLRWLRDVWTSAQDAHSKGVDIRAVTAWALLGSHNWNSLLTRFDDSYEPGVFDVRGRASAGRPLASPGEKDTLSGGEEHAPRPTALAGLMTELAANTTPTHPVLDSPGWWQRSKRLIYPVVEAGIVEEEDGERRGSEAKRLRGKGRLEHNEAVFDLALDNKQQATSNGQQATTPRPLLIAGAGGTLGYAFARLCDHRNLAVIAPGRNELDIADADGVAAVIEHSRPWAVINAAGFADVNGAQRDPARSDKDNRQGAVTLARACAVRGLPFVTLSSAHVFDGGKHGAYVESDPLAPLNVYGCSQAAAEAQIRALCPDALVVRAGLCFGPWDDANFLTRALRQLACDQTVFAAADTAFAPAYIPDLVHACLDLLIDGERGVWHLAHPARVSEAELLRMAADAAGLNSALVQGVSLRSLRHAAPRARLCTLSTERGQLMPSLQTALECYLNDGVRRRLADISLSEHEGRSGSLQTLATQRGRHKPSRSAA